LARKDNLDPAARDALNRAIIDLVGHPTTERRLRTVAFYTAVWVYMILTVAPAVIVLLASTKVLEVDEKWLDKAWTTLTVQFVGVILWIIKAAVQEFVTRDRAR
jgi:hypothetical protein